MEQNKAIYWALASASLALPSSSTVYRPMGITIHPWYLRACNGLICTQRPRQSSCHRTMPWNGSESVLLAAFASHICIL